jgi:hypothetical protein
MDRSLEKDSQICENCYFANEREHFVTKDKWWTCDYNPPKPIDLDDDPLFDNETGEHVFIRQVVVPFYHWCGRWEPNEEWATEPQETI